MCYKGTVVHYQTVTLRLLNTTCGLRQWKEMLDKSKLEQRQMAVGLRTAVELRRYLRKKVSSVCRIMVTTFGIVTLRLKYWINLSVVYG